MIFQTSQACITSCKCYLLYSQNIFVFFMNLFSNISFFLTDIQLSLHQRQQSCTNRTKRTRVKKPLHNSQLNYLQIEVANSLVFSCKSSTASLRRRTNSSDHPSRLLVCPSSSMICFELFI